MLLYDRLYVLRYDFSDDSKDVCFTSGLETSATTSGRRFLSEVYAFLADGDGWIDGHGRVGALGPWCQARSFQMFTLWLFNIAMGNGPFIDGLPIKNGDLPWLC